MSNEGRPIERWQARRGSAALLRAFVLLAPIVCSLLLVHLLSIVLPVPTDSLPLYLSWWVGISGAATIALILVDRLVRRLLPLAALLKLSLAFPDQAPSRFRTALAAGGVESLEERLRHAHAADVDETPAESAQRLLALVAALDSHDRLTRGHAERVRAYSRVIAEELGLTRHELDLLNWSALLHDIGKLEVPSEILTKPGRPTDAEWQILKSHPGRGLALVEPLESWLGEWSRAVGEHHERWDGRGYPHGREGEDIALAARIVSVADVFDVITSARSYKGASSTEEAREELARAAGSQLDPRVVRAFLSVSLGRLRLIMGPLSWLAHAPILGRIPLTPAVSSLAGALAVVTAAVGTGAIEPSTPPPPPSFSTDVALAAPSTTLTTLTRAVEEDTTATIHLPAVTGSAGLDSLRLLGLPAAGRAVVVGGKIRYTPPADFNGKATIRYRACWRSGRCRVGVLRVDVLPVNDKPLAADDRSATRVNEPVVVSVLQNDADPDGDTLHVIATRSLSGGRAELFGDRVRWTPPRGSHRTGRLTYLVSDGNGGRASATVLVALFAWPVPPRPPATPVQPPHSAPVPEQPPAQPGASPPAPPAPPAVPNRAPRAVDDAVTVLEGSVTDVDVLANDGDPDGEALSLVSVGSPGLGTAAAAGRSVRYTAPAVGGSTSFDYVVRDARGATARATVAVTIAGVNDAPSFRGGPDQTVLEGSGATTVSGWATEISPGPQDEAAQRVTFVLDAERPGLFSRQPEVDSSGTLRFATHEVAFGTSSVTVRAIDDGGTENGGDNTSPPQTFTITVLPVNSPPSFRAGPDQTVLEDSGPRTVPNWATDISPGPGNESEQSVSFTVTTNKPGLFSAGPAVSPTGTLTFTPATNSTGVATVTVRAVDDGGTARGGQNTSAPQTFTISVLPVNVQPSFTAGPDQTVSEDSGPRTVPAWATNISPGPANESAQDVTFTVTASAPALFAAGPAVSANGTLTFTPAADANGVATVTVRAVDDGGTANGGDDTSVPRTFTITITAVNDPPVAVDDAVSTPEDSTGVTFDVLANDTDVDTGDTLTLDSFDGSSVTNGTLTANGGGGFTYVPDPSYNGTETFTYVVRDTSGATDGGTVTISVTSVPTAPSAAADAYATSAATTLVVAAPGVLANDADEDGDPLVVQVPAISGPSNGTLTLAADGSFTYDPNPSFVGSDSFTYRVGDGTGLTSDAVVTITVSFVSSSNTLYLTGSGLSSEVWNMSTTAPGAASPVPDYDGDGDEGLTIDSSGGGEGESDPQKRQEWVYAPLLPLVLNGPVTLRLWSTVKDFDVNKDVHPHVYLYDCLLGGVACVKIAENEVHVDDWNATPTWVLQQITVGSVSRTILTGRELRFRLLVQHEDLWVAMTSSYPSGLDLTLG
jgi:HD-GYP domain-containing protein (c-di-GMP phosphodiesterase class II)